MAEGRHSYVAFYPSDWLGGTARMTRVQRSVYFDVCCYNWDKAAECPPSELALMLGDLDGWQGIIDLLVSADKLYRTPDGSVGSTKAMAEAEKARDLWLKKSRGGKDGAGKTNARRGGESHDGSPVETGDETSPGVPPQNQNQNQNQKDTSDKSDTSKPEPKPEKRKSPYPEPFEAFWREYPTDALMSKKAAFANWQRLDQPSRDAARAAIPAFKAYCQKNTTYRPVHAQRFLSDRRFDGFLATAVPIFENTDARGWHDRVQAFRAKGGWPAKWGPKPGEAGCKCPEEILREREAAE